LTELGKTDIVYLSGVTNIFALNKQKKVPPSFEISATRVGTNSIVIGGYGLP